MKLYRYIARRLLLVIPVLIGVSIIVFTLTRVTGDPAAAYINDKMSPHQIELIKQKYHFDEPVVNQYWYWLQGIIQGDWGWSKTATMPVTDAIIDFFPNTAELAIVAIIISIIIGIYVGTVSAVRRNKPFDHVSRVISLIGVSIPVFFFAMILQFVFYSNLGLFDSGGMVSNYYKIRGGLPDITGFLFVDSLLVGNMNLFVDVVWHLILPSITLAFAGIAIILRMQRNSMLEVMSLDYIKTARAKGLPEKVVIRKHARKNALIPTTTVIGLSFGGLLSGAVITESIFQWPGLGRWATASIAVLDSTSVLGFCLLVAIIFVIVNLVVDIMYAYLDPRVRLE